MSAYVSFYPASSSWNFPVISKSRFGVWLKWCLLYLPLIPMTFFFFFGGEWGGGVLVIIESMSLGTSLVVWCLRYHASSAGDMSLMPDGGTKIQHAAVEPKSRKQNKTTTTKNKACHSSATLQLTGSLSSIQFNLLQEGCLFLAGPPFPQQEPPSSPPWSQRNTLQTPLSQHLTHCISFYFTTF